jgi:hypothetical protein
MRLLEHFATYRVVLLSMLILLAFANACRT